MSNLVYCGCALIAGEVSLCLAVKSARLEKDITSAELAKKLHITPRHLGTIENSRKKPSFELLFHMVHELHITEDRFFYPETEHDHLELEEIILSLCQGDEAGVGTDSLPNFARRVRILDGN
jgi:transcriptional regulator with XRE-family HTH domain